MSVRLNRWAILAAVFAVGSISAVQRPEPFRAADTPEVAQAPAQLAPAASTPTAKAPAGPPKPQSVPADAVAVVHQDAAAVQRIDLPFVRWIWVPTEEAEDFKALSDGLAKVSRSATIRRPVVRGVVARIDLRWYAPRVEDLARWLDLWERLAFDPWFSLLITADTIKLLSQEQRARVFVTVRPPWEGGHYVGETWVRKRGWRVVSLVEVQDVIVVRANAPHLSASGLEMLQEATQSLAPIVHYAYFLARALSTIKTSFGSEDRNTVFATVWGGLYYEFSGIPTSKIKGVSDLDALMGYLGIGDGKTPFQKVFDRLRSDERILILRSLVTGKKRVAVTIYSPKARPSIAAPFLSITIDVRDEDVDSSTDPLMNLFAPVAKAHEVIWLDANGQQKFAIYDGAGKLVDEVPPEVAADTTIPSPHTKRLQPAIGCVRCHGPHDGWQPMTNEAPQLLKNFLDVFGDTTNRRDAITDTVDRLAGWYAGQPLKPLMRARDDYAEAVLRATGPWKGSKGQTDVVRLVSERLGRIYAADRLEQVDAATAIREMGFPAAPGKDLELLVAILPPVPERINDIIPEDPRIGTLKAGLKISRFDWALSRSFAMQRARPALEKMRKEKAQ